MKKHRRLQATFDLETEALASGAGLVAGVDEAGRGPWAGPVVAAAVVLDGDRVPAGIADSKALDPRSRERVFASLMECAQIGVGLAEVELIDRANILRATHWAMAEAVRSLPRPPHAILVDGNQPPAWSFPTRAIVRGDARSLSIAAASIVAKVTRDRMMIALSDAWPGYGFEQHKGYGTRQHRDALERLGPCPIHRKSFRPVAHALALWQGGRVDRPRDA